MNRSKSEFFKGGTLAICGSLNIAKALHDCFLHINKDIPADGIYINIYNEERRAVQYVAHADRNGFKEMNTEVPISEDLIQLLKQPNRRGSKVLKRLSDCPVTSRVAPQVVQDPASVILVRMLIEGQSQGVIGLYRKGTTPFTQEDEELCTQLRVPCAIAIANSLKHRELRNASLRLAGENRQLKGMLIPSDDSLMDEGAGLAHVMKQVRQVSHLDSTVLLTGETGSGKEFIANAIYKHSRRRGGPFIKVNCGAIPESLIDSELFGHEKGAFTGAVQRSIGYFEQAHGGTIFLDEIGELPLQAQVRLLRVLQNKKIIRVGGTETLQVDFRLIAATHRNLETMVQENRFREDLLFRINVFPIDIPPLRLRTMDIPALAHHFVTAMATQMGMARIPTITEDQMGKLSSHSWPGNVREFKNCIERAMICCQGGELNFNWIGCPQAPAPMETPEPVNHAPQRLDDLVRQHIQTTLKQTRGKVHGQDGAAQLLGINPSTLRSRMKKLGIPHGRRHTG